VAAWAIRSGNRTFDPFSGHVHAIDAARSVSPEKMLANTTPSQMPPRANPPASPLLGHGTPLHITSIFADAVKRIPVVCATTQPGERSRPHAGVPQVRQTSQANEFRIHRIRYRRLSQSGPKRIDLESDYISKN
jgi:hypothetical protein